MASRSRRRRSFSASSHGQRSPSSSGMPAAILATFSFGWYSSPSINRQPRRRARSSPMVVLPAPDTPISTTITYGSFFLGDRVAPEFGAHHGEEPPGIVGAA